MLQLAAGAGSASALSTPLRPQGAATGVTASWVLRVMVPSDRATGSLLLFMPGYSRGMSFVQNCSREWIAFVWGLSGAVPFIHSCAAVWQVRPALGAWCPCLPFPQGAAGHRQDHEPDEVSVLLGHGLCRCSQLSCREVQSTATASHVLWHERAAVRSAEAPVARNGVQAMAGCCWRTSEMLEWWGAGSCCL